MGTTSKSSGWVGIDTVELEKDLHKIWNNWLTESDYHLFIKYGIHDGRSAAKDFVFHLLEKEVRDKKQNWLLPF